MRWRFLLAAFLLVACGPDEKKPYVRGPGVAPALKATPAPGTYAVSELQIEIAAPSEQHAMWFALGEQPDITQDSDYNGRFKLRLTRSSQVQVMVADPQGRMWGPYSFTYTLREKALIPQCIVATDRSLLNGSQTVGVTVSYFAATEIDEFYLSQDGIQRKVSRDELETDGSLSFAAGPWSIDGTHEFGCRIVGPHPYGHQLEITVDATPPSAVWTGSAGIFGRADWPVNLSLFAADSLSGLADVQMCSPNGCVPGFGMGDGAFQYATAFTAGTHFQTAITAVVSDQAGNVRILNPIPFEIDFDEPSSLPPGPITSTVSAVISIYDFLAPVPGLVLDEVRRVGDFSTALTPGSLPLTAGWNDFLIRQAGKTEWESFAIYRLGFRAEMLAGAGAWLAYASNSTIPAFNGVFLGIVTGSTFNAEWWDIPHVWFIHDTDGDGSWNDADTLCAPGGDTFSGPWARQTVPWLWQAQPGDCTPAGAPVTSASYLLTCSDCADGGQLLMETRNGWNAYPSYHGVNTGVTAAALQSGASVSFPTTAAPLCLFFWDENGNDVADGQDPRVIEPCAAASYDLSRRHGSLRMSISGSAIDVGGLAYGSSAWVTLEMISGVDVISRRSLGSVRESDGIGNATLRIPDDVPRILPWFVRVTDATGQSSLAALPKVGTATAENLWVSVVDDYGNPFTSAAAIVLNGSAEMAGEIYNGDGQPAPVNVSTLAVAWSGIAMRDGYLSVRAPAEDTTATFFLLSAQSAGLLAGRVLDSLDRPVPFANIMWSASPYQSQTMADGEGRFSIPALGAGGLWAEGPEPGQTVSQFFFMETYSQVNDLTLRLSGVGASPARGLLGDASLLSVKGAAPVETVSSPPYYYAAVTGGLWTQVVGAMERRFLYPGYLPSFTGQPFQTIAAPPSVGGGLTQGLACGDRFQPTGLGGTLRIDAPCWRWVADSGLETYFLGIIDGSYEVDMTARFGMLRIDVLNGGSNTLLLTDRLFGRTLRLSVAGNRAEGLVAAGAYAVTLANGTPLVDELGVEATVVLMPGAQRDYIFRTP